ncbi:CDP-alcohol phosphatidyltransferase family protein [Legionella gresilensis]|uniref:CDP-alcohol phosphatidyltransferase family protein n=1 Tax=Legionella gresilensis TaxID=91823 RepID=UPI001041B12C|nr:CDP-alcohol phosphatidyltransferase family protein [Legionella gresilensis]
MISIYNLKPAFQNLLRPASNWLARQNITPNQVTVAAILLSFFCGLLISFYPQAHGVWLLIPLALLLRMILNAIDGMLAREHQMQSALGTFLNELGDVLSDTFLYLPFALVTGIAPLLIISIVVLAIISEMAGVIAIQIGAKRRYDGPMGKSDRAFVFGVISLLFAFGIQASLLINIILGVMVLMLVLTIRNRINQALIEVQS